MKQILAIPAFVVAVISLTLLITSCEKQKERKEKFTPEFNRVSFEIKRNEFNSLADLNRAIRKRSLEVQRSHKGLAKWYVDKNNNPVGICEIFYVKGDAKTLLHELDHCSYGRYHYQEK